MVNISDQSPVVDFEWWQRRPHVILADVRWYLDGRSGLAAYEAGHLRGAIFIDLDRWLSGEPSESQGRHPLPDAEDFARGMATLGIGDDDTVIAYDDAGGVIAARLVWMLRSTNHRAALLDGGLGANREPLEPGIVTRPAAQFTARPWPSDRLASIDDVGDRTKIVIDARSRERYRGEFDPTDVRAGHVPGALSVPCRENVTPNGTLLPVEEVRRRFHELGIREASDVIAYCGSGVTACHDLLAMEYAGLGRGRLYPGSWSQYGATNRAVATGDEPG